MILTETSLVLYYLQKEKQIPRPSPSGSLHFSIQSSSPIVPPEINPGHTVPLAVTQTHRAQPTPMPLGHLPYCSPRLIFWNGVLPGPLAPPWVSPEPPPSPGFFVLTS